MSAAYGALLCWWRCFSGLLGEALLVADQGVQLCTERLVLRLFRPGEAGLRLAYYTNNRAHLAPWEPTREEAFFTVEHHDNVVQQALFLAHQGKKYSFAVFFDAVLVGVVNLGPVERGPFQSCRLGYSLHHQYLGRGLMREAVGAAVRFAFEELKLHRVEANYMVENARSGSLLEALGFERVGEEREYLRINGAWRDHVLTAKKSPL